MEEFLSAICIDANPFSKKLFAGYEKFVQVFDIENPQKDVFQQKLKKAGTDKIEKTLISAIASSNTALSSFAFGCFNKMVYISDLRTKRISLKLTVNFI